MYLPFDKSILSNIPCSGPVLLGPMVITSSITILKIFSFLILLSPMMILITEGVIYPFFIQVNGKKGRKPLVDTSNLQEEIIEKPASSKSDSLVSSAPVAKKRSISKVLDAPADIPFRNDGSVDILEILKTAVRDFDQGIIALGSSRSYKSSNHLYVNSEHYIKVPRESTYDAEMYRVLVNWLRKIHGYEITGQ